MDRLGMSYKRFSADIDSMFFFSLVNLMSDIFTVDFNLPPKDWKVVFIGLDDEPLIGDRPSPCHDFLPNGPIPFQKVCEECWNYVPPMDSLEYLIAI